MSSSVPHAKFMYLTREIVTCNVYLITCIVQARLKRSTKMKMLSKTVPVAVAPPMPATMKDEYKVQEIIIRTTSMVVLGGGNAVEIDRTLMA